MSYKLLAIDVDGTLVNSDHKISEANQTAICAAIDRGIRVTLCTGRGIASAGFVLRRLPLNAPAILNGGALIFDANRRRPLYMRNLQESIAQDAVHLLRTLDCYPIVYSTLPDSQYFYYDDFDPTNEAFQKYVSKNTGRAHQVNDVLETLWADPAMVAATDRVEKIRTLETSFIDGLPEAHVTLEVSPLERHYCHLTLTPKGVSKGTGLRELAALLDIDLADTMAIGDNLNDLDMMTTAGLGVAMGNATPETKDRAGYITGSNNEDGVAQAIKKFILN